MPEYPLQEDLRIKSSFIHKAHEILRNGLEEFLKFTVHMDLGVYLNIMTQNNSTYYDENGKVNRKKAKKKFIILQYYKL